MKKFISTLCLSLAVSFLVQSAVSLTGSITLQMPSGTGTNGASVAYNPSTKEYHASFAGNASFPYTIFDTDGNLKTSRTAEVDIRGLWVYKKKIMHNPYDGPNQPDPNSVGTFSTKNKSILFYHNGKLYYFKPGKSTANIVQLKLDKAHEYNVTSVGYTKKKNMEIVLLNVSKKRLEFFSEKTLILTASVDLPKNIVAEDLFNFAVTNDIAFFFNKKDRMWYGLKLNF